MEQTQYNLLFRWVIGKRPANTPCRLNNYWIGGVQR